ncbi:MULTISPECIES: NAD(P)-binding domain-containing protein [unclassified Chelatococcus]|uniref:NADPH-dependent F420 reductase n=1 Tax=unclassified Chelatococcus TaxID=2638111 RepID=UPI001BCFF7D1|nr:MULTISPECIES: NAD(P)-binding domain-containing protein [unclassified Chelatococcus]MBS7697497.1 NAD(P)-binding domain-containing protein [Chelatococcus sp. YT9]MBX3559428.1 NAD(P)-binding domain-containing protein [Chelatococcus sp.]
MDIGIIGTGLIGGTLARRLSKLGHKVFVANSRGPASLADIAAETGATAVTVHQAARSGEIVFVTIPEWRIPDLPKDLFKGVSPEVVVVDTGNYYPRERDGRIDEIEEGMAESRWVAIQLGRPVLKAINTLHWRSLLDEGKPTGSPDRIALPVAGDDAAHKAKVIRLFDELGFDGVDAGQLDESWRQQPATPVYAANLDADGVRRALTGASPERTPEFRAAPNSSRGKPV